MWIAPASIVSFFLLLGSISHAQQSAKFSMQCSDGALSVGVPYKKLNDFMSLKHLYDDVPQADKNNFIPIDLSKFSFATSKLIKDYFDKNIDSDFYSLINPNALYTLSDQGIVNVAYWYALSIYFDHKQLLKEIVSNIFYFFNRYSIQSCLKITTLIDQAFAMPTLKDSRKIFLENCINAAGSSNTFSSAVSQQLLASVETPSHNYVTNLSEIYAMLKCAGILARWLPQINYTRYPYSCLMPYLTRLPESLQEKLALSSEVLLAKDAAQKMNRAIALHIETNNTSSTIFWLHYGAALRLKFMNLEAQEQDDEEKNYNLFVPLNCSAQSIAECLQLMLIEESPEELKELIQQFIGKNNKISKAATYLVIADFFGS